MKRMGIWEWKILRRIYGLVVEQGKWTIRTNQELRELYKDLDKIADIKKKRLELNGHVGRIDQGRTIKHLLENKPERSTRRRRQKTEGSRQGRLGFCS